MRMIYRILCHSPNFRFITYQSFTTSFIIFNKKKIQHLKFYLKWQKNLEIKKFLLLKVILLTLLTHEQFG